jgi:glycosyltransferase involved in cell wall biosynthesis
MKDKIAVVIPAFGVSKQILQVIKGIDQKVSKIIVVDDCCPENSGRIVQSQCKDKRVKVIFNNSNLGVGGSMIAGYQEALTNKPLFIVKIDGDGQMDPKLISKFVGRLQKTGADYAKGNRFADPENLFLMPKVRILGNLILSFFAKFSTGYWNIFDPNNGYTVIRGEILSQIPLKKISHSFFFESDMLFRLNLLGAHVIDVPMKAIYGSETSNLKISKTIAEFTIKHYKNFVKRIAYNYFIKDFNLASVELLLAMGTLFLGSLIGATNFIRAEQTQNTMSVGILVLVSILIISGLQLLLSFFNFDMSTRGNNKSG